MVKRYVLTIFLLILAVGVLFAQPAAPQLQSPQDGATDLPTTITFEWSSVSSADRYQIQVAEEDPTFSGSSIVFSDNTTSTSITLSGFSHSTTYYWRVRSGEDDPLLGTTTYGDWSETRSFTTVEAPPPAPVLVSPNDGDTVSTSPTLDWDTAERADTYQVQVDQTSDFSSPIVDSTAISATQAEVSGLQSMSTFYWRVRADNNGGVGSWSETRSFTTREAPPPAVQLVAPDSGATGITTTPVLDWEPASRADVYDLQLATDQDFNEKIVELEDVTSTQFEADLNGFTTYYWRIRGQNESGPGDWSSVWNFTTEQTGSEITIIAPSTGDLLKAGETFTIRWNATNNVGNVMIEYSLGSNEPWTQIVESVDADSEIYAWSVPDISSTQARIKISDTDNPDINGVSKSFILYPQSIQLQQTYTFNSASSPSDYQLIGLPAQSNIPIDELISGTQGEDWNAYFDDGTQENYLMEFDGSAQFNLRPGRGFFVISKNSIDISENAPSVELSEDTSFAIPLHEGWNIIANPYGITIPWENVEAKNNISSTLWAFNGSYSDEIQFKPYIGYYFFNQDSLDELVIPYQPKESSSSNKNIVHSKKQILTLKLLKNNVEKSSIQIGYDSGLKNGDEAIYRFAPPGDFQTYKLTIESEKSSGRQGYLAKEFRPVTHSRKTFALNLKSLPDEQITLKTEGTDDFPSQEIVLIDRQTSKTFNLKRQKEVFLRPEQLQSQYMLIIGSAKEVKEIEDELSPTKFTLSQNYPNPFNGQTVIEYSVPEGTSNTPVRLEIYDILGRKVATLVNTQQAAGRYQVRWDAENTQGNLLSSGTYFYRLSIGSNVKTKQLTLIK